MARNLFLLVEEKDRKLINYFLLGLLSYEVCNFIFPFFPFLIVRFVQLIAILGIIYSFVRISKHFSDRTKYIKIYWFFLFWSFVCVLRINSLDYKEVQLMLFHPVHILAYLVPIVYITPVNKPFLKATFRFSIVTTFLLFFFFTVISLLLFKESNTTDLLISAFGSGAIFLFFTWRYHKIWVRYLSLLGIIFSAYIGAVNGRRNVILISFVSLIFGCICLLLHNSKYNLLKTYTLTLLLIIASIVGYLSIDITQIEHFSALSERLNTDSRSDVITAFINDMDDLDWLVGRGVDGAYYNPIKYWNFLTNESRDVSYRDTIENGYLFIILKMGLVGLLLFLYLIVSAIYNGLFKSKNILTKAAALFLITYLIEMISFGQPALSLKYFFVWLSIAICHSTNTRSLSENAMKKIFM